MFGAEWVYAIDETKQREVVILNHGEDPTFAAALAQDGLEFIMVFSTRRYGSHSRKT